MLDKTDTTWLTAITAFQKDTAAKITTAQTKTAILPVELSAMPLITDSFDYAHVIDNYNNYTSAGTHSNTAHNINQTNTTSISQMKDDDIMLPWWLVMMLRNANPDSEWIKQMIEEAGLENMDTEKLSAAEELLEDIGGNSKAIQSDKTETDEHRIDGDTESNITVCY